MVRPLPIVDEALVASMIAKQFPAWAGQPVRRVARQGWDHHTFRLGDDKLVRLPREAAYAPQVVVEHRWLPELGARLSLPIPMPLALGEPGEGHAWAWGVYRWIDGEPARIRTVESASEFAADLAAFLRELHSIDPMDGPAPGARNFHRGGALAPYEREVDAALARLAGRLDAEAARGLWHHARDHPWNRAPLWVHGDIAPGNLLTRGGRLSGVIDFGAMAVGDPACDYTLGWTVFRGAARDVFLSGVDEATRLRARAWGLWKGLVVASGISRTTAAEWRKPLEVLEEILADA